MEAFTLKYTFWFQSNACTITRITYCAIIPVELCSLKICNIPSNFVALRTAALEEELSNA